MLNMCSRVTLLSSLNSSIFFSYYFYPAPPIFLELESIFFGASTSLSPTFAEDENMCLDTTFTLWEISARKDVSVISSSSYPLDDFRTCHCSPLNVCLSAARIVLSSFLAMTSMIKSDYIMHPLPYLELQNPP